MTDSTKRLDVFDFKCGCKGVSKKDNGYRLILDPPCTKHAGQLIDLAYQEATKEKKK